MPDDVGPRWPAPPVDGDGRQRRNPGDDQAARRAWAMGAGSAICVREVGTPWAARVQLTFDPNNNWPSAVALAWWRRAGMIR